MAVGLAVTKGEIDARAGDLARAFQNQFGDVVTLQGYLETTAEADLIALGYTSADVALLKSAIGDLAHLARIWAGTEALPEAKDFRSFVRQIWGVGAF